MRDAILKCGWQMDKAYVLVCKGDATRSWARGEQRNAIAQMLMDCPYISLKNKRNILKELNYTHQSKYADIMGRSRQGVSRQVLKGRMQNTVKLNGRVFIYTPKTIDE